MNFFRSVQTKMKRGFTLIELLVVMGIFIVITSVVLARQNRFSSDILLSDLAYQIGISIRQAQVYGLGVRSASGVGITGNVGLTYDTGYGISFGGALPLTSYLFFPDLDKDGVADSNEIAPSTQGVVNYNLSKGQTIKAVCATKTNGGSLCLGDDRNITSFNVVYDRPDPSAKISTNTGQFYNRLVITIASSLGDRFKCVTVYGVGQIAVSNPLTTGADPSNPCLATGGGIIIINPPGGDLQD